MKVPKGHSGSWFAEWEGEKLPCVHQHWTKGCWPKYVDPGLDDRSEWRGFIEALKTKKKVILTTSHPPDENGIRRRKSYVAIYEIDNVQTDGGQLTFDFVGPPKRFR